MLTYRPLNGASAALLIGQGMTFKITRHNKPQDSVAHQVRDD